MAVTEQIPEVAYVANGATSTFPFNFKIPTVDDLLVAWDGVELDDGFSVSGLGTSGGGNVVFAPAPADGVAVTIQRSTRLLRQTDYQQSGDFLSPVVNSDFDRTIFALQEIAAESDRSIRAAVGEPGITLPSGAANPNSVLGTDANGVFGFQPPGSAGFVTVQIAGGPARTLAAVLGERISALALGVRIDGSNTTATLAAAMSQAVSLGVPLYLTAGTYLVNNLVIPADVTVNGDGQGKTIIKRVANAPGTAFLSAVGHSNITLRDLTIDGNRANQVNAANNLAFVGGTGITLDHVTSINAKASGGYGLGVAISGSTNQIAHKKTRLLFSEFSHNDDAGVYITKSSNILVQGCLFADNGADGCTVIDYQFPPVPFVQNYLQFVGNHALYNTNTGISVIGFFTGGTAGAPIFGNGAQAAAGVTISGNICIGNGFYGIAGQGRGVSIIGNHCESNGGNTDTYGGIVCCSLGASLIGNTLVGNSFYGIDIGGSQSAVVIGNTFIAPCATTGYPGIVINCGGTINCKVEGNLIDMDGTTAAGVTSIYCSGYEYGGGTYFDWIGLGISIKNNDIRLTSTSHLGVLINHGTDQVSLEGNSVRGANGGNAYQLNGGINGMQLVEKNNTDWAAGIIPSVASAATLVIPDTGSDFYVTGSTGIASILTNSAANANRQVHYVQITNGGGSYVPSTPPTVTFSGGGGAGAAGIALVSNSGFVIGVQITSGGSGYTSLPTCTFGWGAATAVALVGCNNFIGKTIALQFLTACTVTQGSNLLLNGNFTSSGGGASILVLRGSFGNWYEVSRRV